MQAKDLTDEHIGLKFEFRGSPNIVGIYQGHKGSRPMRGNKPFLIGVDNYEKFWAKDSSGYYIARNAEVIQLPQDPKNSDPVREKLAEYIQAQMQERGRFAMNQARSLILADIFTELMEVGPDA